ncbi:transposase [Streptomyces sp. NPDC056982]|uniref:transposase n=1 Tax=Streptomyces sp. NPDC056982 TaxID=3345986 RepID=UPI0036424CF5
MRDRLDGLWCDKDFADWYPRDGRPGISPTQLATVCVLPFLLGLSDRQAAEAVRCRIDFKYVLAIGDASVFRAASGELARKAADIGFGDGAACNGGAPRQVEAPAGTGCDRQWRAVRAAECDRLIAHRAGLDGTDPPLVLSFHPVSRRLHTVPSPQKTADYKHREDFVDALCVRGRPRCGPATGRRAANTGSGQPPSARTGSYHRRACPRRAGLAAEAGSGDGLRG